MYKHIDQQPCTSAVVAPSRAVAESAARCLRGLGWIGRVAEPFGTFAVYSDAPTEIVARRVDEFAREG